MLFALLATLVVALHLAFVLFVFGGGLLVRRRPHLAWLHLPCAAWGIYVELAGEICPLTPLENALRQRAGEAGYAEGFLEHYLIAIVYPSGLTPALQWVLGGLALAVNLAVYAWILRRRMMPPSAPRP
jgi:hypothetical protein